MAVRFSQILLRKINNTNNHYKNFTLYSGYTCTCGENTLKKYSIWRATKSGDETDEQQKKKKTVIIPKITLLQGNEITVTTLEDAQKLSKRRDLKLVKIVDIDTKSQRPIYKLMTATEYHAEDLKQKEQKKKNKEGAIKGEKLLILNYNIANHDIETNVKKISKWIGKSYEVRIVINGDSNLQKAVSEENWTNIS